MTPGDVEREDGDAVDSEAGVFLGRAEAANRNGTGRNALPPRMSPKASL